MAYLVVVIGGLMVLAGAYEAYLGNAIISVERGWSAFISGTILFTGGLVTMAIGLATHALRDLKLSLMQVSTSTRGNIDAGSLTAHAVQPEASIGAPDAAFSVASATVDDRHEPADYLPRPGREQHTTLGEHDLPAPEPPPPAAHGDDHEAAPDGVRLRPSLDPTPPTAPAADDWLERSFADLDRDSAMDAARAAGSRGHAAREEPAFAPIAVPTQTMFHEPETRSDPSLDHEEIAADHAPAADHGEAQIVPVIGRYEAEGTSYVMYADGSIEAQSDAGVYRFASMAELKTFIES